MKRRKSRFGSGFQRSIVAAFVTLPDFAARFKGLLTEDIIDDPDLALVVEATRKVLEATKGQLPTKPTLEHACPKQRLLIRELFTTDLRDRDYLASEVASYAQQKACETAALQVAQAIKDQKTTGIVAILQEALQVGLDVADIGEYLKGATSAERFAEYLYPDLEHRVPTGLTHLDLLMGGGLSAGELGIILGPAKGGKSFGLMNIGYGVANAMHGKRVIHYSLEMKQRKVLKRYDARVAGGAAALARTEPYKFVRALDERTGRLVTGNILVKSWPTRTATYSMMCAHLARISSLGFRPDMIIVDYGDIMKAERRIGEMRHEQASCFEDLRRMAGEFGLPCWTACFVAGTRIDTPRGKIPIEDLPPGHPVYTFDHKLGKVRVANTSSGGVRTRRRAKLVRVTLDNEEHIDCTPDHLFMLRDGSYKEASKLVAGTSLMPFVRKPSSSSAYKGYDTIYLCDGRFEFEHRVVGEFINNGPIPKDHVVHHADENKVNNSDLNLRVISRIEHTAIHATNSLAKKRMSEGWVNHCKNMRDNNPMRNPDTVARMVESKKATLLFGDDNPMRRPEVAAKFQGDKNWKRTKRGRKHAAQVMKARWAEGKMPAPPKYSKDFLILMGRRAAKEMGGAKLFQKDFTRITGISSSPIYATFKTFPAFRDAVMHNNHTVVSVVPLTERRDVYDLEVPETHNFALAAGVFVHNSQLNRGAFNKATPDMADVAEAFEKVAIGDAIIGIGRTPEEAANKRSRLIMMGLRDEPSNQIIHLIDDRSRALWKTLEIGAASKTDKPKSDKENIRDTILAKAKKRAKEGLGGD